MSYLILGGIIAAICFTPAWLQRKNTFYSFLIIPILYVISFFEKIYSGAGADYSLFFKYSLYLIPINILLFVLFHLSQKFNILENHSFSLASLSKKVSISFSSLLPAIGIALLSFIIIYFIFKNTYSFELYHSKNSLFWLFILIALPIRELVLRCLFQPLYGVGNVAFLEAIVISTALQSFAPFMFILISSYLSGILSQKHHQINSAVFQVVTHALIFVFLMFFQT